MTGSKFLISAVILLITSFSFASSDGSHGEIPFGFIKLQTLNFLVFAGLLIYLSKSKISPFLKKTKEDYVAKSMEAALKFEEIKGKKDELETKLSLLEKNFEDTLTKAKEQAEATYKKSVLETKDKVSNLNKDLETQLDGIKRANSLELKDMLMSQSINSLKDEIGSDFDESLLTKIQNKFVEHVDLRM